MKGIEISLPKEHLPGIKVWGSLVDDNRHGSLPPRAGDPSSHVQLFWFQPCDEFRLPIGGLGFSVRVRKIVSRKQGLAFGVRSSGFRVWSLGF